MKRNKTLDDYCRDARTTQHTPTERVIANPSSVISRNPFVAFKIADAQARKYGERATGTFRCEGQVIPS